MFSSAFQSMNSHSEVEVVESKLFSTVVADEIHASIDDAVSERGSCSLFVAGGKTTSAIYRVLSRPPKLQEIPWENLRIYWGDERWVAHSHDQSNFKMVNETILTHLKSTKPAVFPVDTSLESPRVAAQAYAEVIRGNEKEKTASGVPIVDIIILGVGTDGHIASVFPGYQRDQGEICAATINPDDGSQRVTIAPDLIKAAKRVIFIVSGDRKADIIRRIAEGGSGAEGLPANVFRECSGKVTWFLDYGSARKIQGS